MVIQIIVRIFVISSSESCFMGCLVWHLVSGKHKDWIIWKQIFITSMVTSKHWFIKRFPQNICEVFVRWKHLDISHKGWFPVFAQFCWDRTSQKELLTHHISSSPFLIIIIIIITVIIIIVIIIIIIVIIIIIQIW